MDHEVSRPLFSPFFPSFFPSVFNVSHGIASRTYLVKVVCSAKIIFPDPPFGRPLDAVLDFTVSAAF